MSFYIIKRACIHTHSVYIQFFRLLSQHLIGFCRLARNTRYFAACKTADYKTDWIIVIVHWRVLLFLDFLVEEKTESFKFFYLVSLLFTIYSLRSFCTLNISYLNIFVKRKKKKYLKKTLILS